MYIILILQVLIEGGKECLVEDVLRYMTTIDVQKPFSCDNNITNESEKSNEIISSTMNEIIGFISNKPKNEVKTKKRKKFTNYFTHACFSCVRFYNF